MAFTFQAHDYMVKNQKDYQILMLPYYVGWTNGPSTIPALIQQRNRWQRVTNEAVWRYRYMFLNPKYKWLAVFTYPYLLVYEVFGVFVEIFSIAMLTWAWFIHILDLKIYLSYLFFLVMVQAFISLSVIFAFIRDQQIFRFRYTCYLILLSFLELFAYRWIIAVARIRGIFGSIRGVRDFDQFKRQQNLV
jgi:cellulose synthase/poly-beta-1,6-N-acetylglucosamine synthase-like glycosyltransferase